MPFTCVYKFPFHFNSVCKKVVTSDLYVFASVRFYHSIPFAKITSESSVWLSVEFSSAVIAVNCCIVLPFYFLPSFYTDMHWNSIYTRGLYRNGNLMDYYYYYESLQSFWSYMPKFWVERTQSRFDGSNFTLLCCGFHYKDNLMTYQSDFQSHCPLGNMVRDSFKWFIFNPSNVILFLGS